MTTTPDSSEPGPAVSRRLSRRHALFALAGGAGAIALGEFGGAGATAADPMPSDPMPSDPMPSASTSGALTEPGVAIKPAERLSLRRLPAGPPPAGKLLFPVEPANDCYVLDNFGSCRSGGTRSHSGIDILGSRGNPVYAVADGELVTRYANTGDAGWGWSLSDAATNTIYKYFHLMEDPNGLILKQRVRMGDVLGFVGNSGTYGVDNYHLHFEVRPGNVAVDPLPLLHYDPDVIPTGPADNACVGLPGY